MMKYGGVRTMHIFKTGLLCLLMSTGTFATPITLDSISITGSGSWEWDFGLGTFEHFSFTGTDGLHTVSAAVDTGTESPLFSPVTTFGGMDRCYTSGTVVIDGIVGVPNCDAVPDQSVFVVDGFAKDANIYGPGLTFSRPLEITVPLVGFMHTTSHTEEFWDDSLVAVRETFTISPTISNPEPSYTILVGFFCAALLAWQLRAQARSRT
jgi:hypothetical protein